MTTDWLGNPVSSCAPATLAAIDDFIGGMLAYDVRAMTILDAANADPGHALTNAYAGMLAMLAEDMSAADTALPFLARAQGAAIATRRERCNIDALACWAAGDIDGAIAAFQTCLAEAPRDLLALKLLHYHQFNRGEFAAMLASALSSLPAADDVGYLHGMLAFAYEQCHLLREAEEEAVRALAITPSDPWAQHALAHVMLTEGRISEGVDFLERRAAGWTGLNSFMLTHLWWHLALLYLSQGRFTEALGLYDDHVWGMVKDYSQDQIGAVSLLARLEIAGIDIGDRWQELARHLAARAEDVTEPFLSVQYLYGLLRAGAPEAASLLAAIRRAAEHRGGAWAEAALPLALGLDAYVRGDHVSAERLLQTALPHLVRMGGSHAQRDLFDQILLEAQIGGGAYMAAQQQLELRRAHDPDGVPLNRKLATVYAKLGLADLSDAARRRADA